jgi:hypothetical protein
MVWTNQRFQNQGYATHLLEKLIRSTAKPIFLDVNKNNPARFLYHRLGFKTIDINGTRERMAVGRRIAIMQPYAFPYIGYLQLINASDLFVFYDDVNYIKRGRINRNNILLNGKEFSFTLPVANASQNRLIKDTLPAIDDHWRDTFIKRLTYAYKKAPYFNQTMERIEGVLSSSHTSIADLAIASIASAFDYMRLELNYVKSSDFSPETREMEKSDRLIAITKKAHGQRYVNTISGQKLYDKTYFMERGVNLSFIKNGEVTYPQFGNIFAPKLSIIDLMMFNHGEAIREFCHAYSII